jgi:GNAT superfamily N-acetyltransferase
MSLTVEPVRGRRALNEFLRVPFRLHGEGTPWVPPLVSERRRFLDRSKNPFFEHADAEYFLARRDGRAVGRISAQVDRRWDEFQGGNDGWFGFFETEDDAETAGGLLDAAAAWLRGRGRERMLGPADFTTNDECGLLVEGYEHAPMILQPWHPPHYRQHVESWGMTKTIDLLMWKLWLGELKQGDQFHDFIEDAARTAEREHGVKVRNVNKRELDDEFRELMKIYNEAWGSNWGFVPITDEERRFQTENLKPVLDENWTMVAEIDGEVVGGAITLPDINQVLVKMRGRLLPLGWWHFLTGRRRIDSVRVFALGVRSRYQHMGVAAALYVRHRQTAERMPQKGGETGWILETNEPMNRAMEGMGGEVIKRYRIYERGL